LGHHRHAWRPEDSIAELIDQQLPKIIGSCTNADEEAVGEPAEYWWNALSLQDSAFILDSSWSIGSARRGVLDLRYISADIAKPNLRGICTAIRAEDNHELARWHEPTPSEFSKARIATVPWVRLDEELFPRDQNEGLGLVRAALGDVLIPFRLHGSRYAVICAAVFPTELTHNRTGESWVAFMISGAKRDFTRDSQQRVPADVIRILRAGTGDRMSRAPSSAVLRTRRILVAGVGAIGATVALELSRNGVGTLGMVDPDVIVPGNGVRWPLGESVWGQSKVAALEAHILANYSMTSVEKFCSRLGDVDLDSDTGPGAELGRFMKEADAVIDATASSEIASLLAERCAANNIPLITVNATPSLEGGAVARFVAGDGCPTCVIFHQQGDLPTIPIPAGENGNPESVALPGCAEATFEGASFDLNELALEAVRLLVKTFTLSAANTESVVETLSFVPPDRLPSWRADRFSKHERCNCR